MGASDILVLVGVAVCYQACMFLSSVYHTFCCHSRTVSEKCLSLDLAGITLALLATYLSGVYYSFFCLPGWRDFYLVTVAGMFMVAAVVQLWPKFASFYWLRLILFCAWAAYGVVPTAHFVVLNGGLGSALVPVILPRVVAMYAITGLAFVFYVFKMPERLVGYLPKIYYKLGQFHILSSISSPNSFLLCNNIQVLPRSTGHSGALSPVVAHLHLPGAPLLAPLRSCLGNLQARHGMRRNSPRGRHRPHEDVALLIIIIYLSIVGKLLYSSTPAI